MNIKQLETHGFGTPEAEVRTRADYVREYITFKQRVEKECFEDSGKLKVISLLTDMGVESPYTAFYYYNEELINSSAFPGSPQYWHKLISWAWDMVRAYGDGSWDAPNGTMVEALQLCADEFKQLITLIVEYA